MDWNAYVRWVPGRRYGVVTRDRQLAWRVIWIDNDKVRRTGNRPVLGGGEVHLDVSEGEAVPLRPDEVETLGLDAVRAPS